MSDTVNLRERVQSRRAAAPADDEADTPDARRSYGLLRGNKERAVMLTFRLQDGSEDAYPLTLLERVYFHPSQGITIRFVGVLVQIEGENLGATPAAGVGLLEGLRRQRVPWVAEADPLHAGPPAGDDALVTRIRIETVY